MGVLPEGSRDDATYKSLDQECLFKAVKANKTSLVKNILMKKKVDAKEGDMKGYTALHRAVECSALDVVELLITAEPLLVNQMNYDGQTPLQMSIKLNDKKVLTALLKTDGVNINLQDNYSSTAIHHAVKSNNPDILQMLLGVPDVDVNLTDRLERTPLLLASELNHYFCAVLLVRSGADTSCGNYAGQTAIEVAIAKKHEKIANVLNHNDLYIEVSNTKVPNSESNLLQCLLEDVEQTTLKDKQKWKLGTETIERVKKCMQTYNEHLCQIWNNYKSILSHVTSEDQLMKMIEVWNCDFLRPKIDLLDRRNVSQTVQQAKKEEKCQRSVKNAHMLERLKKELYNNPTTKHYVEEVYEDSGKLFVSIDHGTKMDVQKLIREKFGDIDLIIVEQEEFDSSIYLMGEDNQSAFLEKTAIGPGSCIVNVSKEFAEEIVLTGEGRDLTFGDMILNANYKPETSKAAGQAAKDMENLSEAANNNEPSHGTLGCLVQVHFRDKTDLYGLSVKHILSTDDDGLTSHSGVYIVTGIKVKEKIDMSVDGITDESYDISLQDTVCFSDSFVGIHQKTSPPFVDVVLLGPVHQHLLDRHKQFVAKVEQEIEIYRGTGEDYAKKNVKKVGAVTRLRRGKILNYINNKGLFVVVPQLEQNFAEKGDSGAIVLQDDTSQLVGMGLVYKTVPEYERGNTKYKDVVFCVRLDYCIDELYKILKLDPKSNKIKLYYGHVTPDVETQFKKKPETT